MKLTVKQAAARANVCVNLIYSWCATRRLRHIRAGAPGRRGKILIDEADLDAFLASQVVEPVEVAPPNEPAPRPVQLKHLSLD